MREVCFFIARHGLRNRYFCKRFQEHFPRSRPAIGNNYPWPPPPTRSSVGVGVVALPTLAVLSLLHFYCSSPPPALGRRRRRSSGGGGAAAGEETVPPGVPISKHVALLLQSEYPLITVFQRTLYMETVIDSGLAAVGRMTDKLQ